MEKTRNPDNKLTFDYNLTQRGRNLEPILFAVGKWGHIHIEGTSDIEGQIKRMATIKKL
ncbi:MAG: winged helix-turn-helix transcriptional regulator [Cytophagales bacterium]|nr:winged helix-turn-helix transcriptional regulator [Cytophagales bacterium]